MTRILETDEHGALVIPAEMLRDSAPKSRYVVEQQGRALRLEPAESADQLDHVQQEWRTWLESLDSLRAKLDLASTTDRSAIDILSEMRR